MTHASLHPATVRWVLPCLATLLFAGGCVTPSPGHARPGDNKEIQEARRLVKAGDHTLVIPRLLHLVDRAPESGPALEARYLLGVVYRDLDSYKDAIEAFNEYLRLAPEGEHAEEARASVAELNEEYASKYQTTEQIEAKVKKLTAQLEAEPGRAEYKLALADLLWKRGTYDRAAELYADVLESHTEYANNKTITSRIEPTPEGGYVILTPSEMERRQIAEKPLVVFNEYTYRAGRDRIAREYRRHVVTGQVVNRSDSVLYGVQVIVTVYGFGNVVYATNTVNIGRMNPKETRAFSVRFSDLDDTVNIQKYECTATFQR